MDNAFNSPAQVLEANMKASDCARRLRAVFSQSGL